MKKAFPITISAVIVIIAVTLFASCKKEYNCMCTYIDAGGVLRMNTGSFQGSKVKARKACEDNADYLSTIGTDVDCSL